MTAASDQAGGFFHDVFMTSEKTILFLLITSPKPFSPAHMSRVIESHRQKKFILDFIKASGLTDHRSHSHLQTGSLPESSWQGGHAVSLSSLLYTALQRKVHLTFSHFVLLESPYSL